MNIPTNKKLYESVKNEAKKKFKVYPSAYANSWLVRTYKSRGGKYKISPKKSDKKSRYTKKSITKKSNKKSRYTKKSTPNKSNKKENLSGLDRWYKEEWINVCKLPKIVKCGRSKSSDKNYPYCRPRYRINSKSPKNINEIPKKELMKRCAIKRKIKSKRLNRH